MARLILLFGYWPPTDCGVPERPGMLSQWSTRQTVTFEGKTFDVLAMSPRFDCPLGTSLRNNQEPFWGRGETSLGSFTVDYRDTSARFWNLVEQHRPVAIMSFSRWGFDNHWFLDAWGTNWSLESWTTELAFIDLQGHVRQMTWLPPIIGGSDLDCAPVSHDFDGQTGNGPDDTRPTARAVDPGQLPPMSTRRFSNLPMAEIVSAIGRVLPAVRVNPEINTVLGPGRFVSNFLAYHVAWYRDWWNSVNNNPQLACLISGHTHVGGQVSSADGELAVEIQLRELIRALPEAALA